MLNEKPDFNGPANRLINDWRNLIVQTKDLQLRLANNAKRRKPLLLAIKVYFLYLVLLALTPVQPVFSVEWSGVIFLVITVIAAMGGMWASFLTLGKGDNFFKVSVDFVSMSRYIILISLVGIALLLFDRFVIRGVGVAEDPMKAREVIESAGTSIIGMLAAFLSSFSVFGVISTWLVDHVSPKSRKKLKVLAYINLTIYLCLSIMLGSRLLLLYIFVIHLLAKLLISERLDKGRIKIFVGSVLVLGCLILTVFVLMFQSRLSLMGLSAIDSIQFSGYTYTLGPTENVLDFLRGNEFLEIYGAAAYSLILYTFHGVYEFFLLFNNLEGQQTHGAMTFWLPIKVVESLFGSFGLLNLDLIPGLRLGVFTTFVGPLFLDFSQFTPVAAFVIFYFLSLPNKFVSRGNSQWLFLVIMAEVVIIFSPIFSVLESGSGMYLLIDAFIIGLFAPKLKSYAK